GSEIAAGTQVTITIPSVTNQKYAGSSGVFISLYTTLSSDVKIDEATSGSSTLPPAVTFTPSTFGGNAGAVTPSTLAAGATGTSSLVFTTGNPLPADGKIILELPTTFFDVNGGTPSIVSGMDGNLVVNVYTTNVITLTRSGGSEVATGTEVTITIPSATNQKYAGSSGAFVALYTTLSTGVKIDEATSGSSTLPPAVTFTPSTFGGNAGAVTPASLIAGAAGSVDLVFTTGNPLPSNGKIVVEFPTTFHAVAATAATAKANIDGALAASTVGRVVTMTRSGGAEITAGTQVTITIPSITNQKYAGSSGAFIALYTTLSSDVKIDEATSGSSTLPPAVTFTPSTFGGNAGAATPASLVAGAAGNVDLVFTTGNPLPVDGKIVLEFPTTFHAVAATAATAGTNIDGALTASSSGRAVTITRAGDGSVIAAGTQVTVTIPSITNQKYAGSSGVFVALRTTVSSGAKIDEATSGSSTLPPAVTFTPSTFGGNAGTVTPASLVAGAATTANLVFTTGNPLPADGKIIFEFPTTFHAIAATAATAVSNCDGTLSASTNGRTVTITRSGGSVIAAGTEVTITTPSVTNQKYAGSSGVFVSLYTTLSTDVKIDEATTGSSTLPPAVTFTPSTFGGNAGAVTPASLISGAAGSVDLVFTTGNPLPVDGKIILEFPTTFHAVAATAATAGTNMDGALTASSSGRAVTITRAGDGSIINKNTEVTITIPSITNQKYEGSSGVFVAMYTTISSGAKIDEATSGSSTLPPAVTFTPSIFGGVSTTVTPASLIAGAAGNAALVFTTGNPIPADGKIIVEFPNTFHAVAATAATATNNIDGTLTASSSGRAVTITRSGGSEIAAGTAVTITIPSITNQKFEGSSNVFVALKTTLSDGTTRIDEATSASSTLPSAVTFTPSTFGDVATTVTPASLVAGDAGNSVLVFTTGNPLPADGKIVVEFPTTFTSVAATAATAGSGIDGTLTATTSGRAVTITRAGGSVITAGTEVTVTIPSITNQKYEGSSNVFVDLKTTLSDGTTRIDQATAGSSTLPAAVTFTPSGFSGATPTLVPVSRVAGEASIVEVTFRTTNPWPVNGKLIFTMPDTFHSKVDNSQFVSDLNNADGTMTATITGTGPWTLTCTRSGDGSEVAAGVDVTLRVGTRLFNQNFEGASGAFPMIKTTLNDGTTAIDESSAEGDAIGNIPSSITFTPSAWGGTTPSVVPVSLVAGAVTDATITFTTANPWTADGKLIFEIPDTFTNVGAVSVAVTSGIDGTFSIAQTGTTTVLASTLKTAGGSWVVTITRAGDGTAVAAGVEVVIVLTDVTNQQHEGSSGTFTLFKTTLADGTTAIDESSAEGDAIGALPPAVVFTPSGWGGTTPSIVPVSLVAGAVTDATITFTTGNPWALDGKLIFEIPNTFTNVGAASVAITSGVDGTFSVAQTGATTVLASTLKTAGGSWVVTITRAGDGATVATGTQV
ncbi:hypothetical protein TrLO_g4272, partial [Triparma laevis f. longispina]